MTNFLLLLLFAMVSAMIALGNNNRLQLEGGSPGTFGKPYEPRPEKPKPKPKPKPHADLFARVKYAGTGAVAISGKIAGTVFTNSGVAGPFMRVWAKARNRRTQFQQLVRGILSGISSSWRNLTADQITAWNNAATSDNSSALRKDVFGDTRVVTGSQLYQRLNNIMLAISAATYADPPLTASTDSILSAVPNFLQTGQVAELDITTFAGATTVPANTDLEVYATPQKSNGRSFFGKSQYRLLFVYPPTTAINPLDIATEYTAKFGALVSGSKIGIKMNFVFHTSTQFGKSGSVYATASVGA